MEDYFLQTEYEQPKIHSNNLQFLQPEILFRKKLVINNKKEYFNNFSANNQILNNTAKNSNDNNSSFLKTTVSFINNYSSNSTNTKKDCKEQNSSKNIRTFPRGSKYTPLNFPILKKREYKKNKENIISLFLNVAQSNKNNLKLEYYMNHNKTNIPQKKSKSENQNKISIKNKILYVNKKFFQKRANPNLEYSQNLDKYLNFGSTSEMSKQNKNLNINQFKNININKDNNTLLFKDNKHFINNIILNNSYRKIIFADSKNKILNEKELLDILYNNKINSNIKNKKIVKKIKKIDNTPLKTDKNTQIEKRNFFLNIGSIDINKEIVYQEKNKLNISFDDENNNSSNYSNSTSSEIRNNKRIKSGDFNNVCYNRDKSYLSYIKHKKSNKKNKIKKCKSHFCLNSNYCLYTVYLKRENYSNDNIFKKKKKIVRDIVLRCYNKKFVINFNQNQTPKLILDKQNKLDIKENKENNENKKSDIISSELESLLGLSLFDHNSIMKKFYEKNIQKNKDKFNIKTSPQRLKKETQDENKIKNKDPKRTVNSNKILDKQFTNNNINSNVMQINKCSNFKEKIKNNMVLKEIFTKTKEIDDDLNKIQNISSSKKKPKKDKFNKTESNIPKIAKTNNIINNKVKKGRSSIFSIKNKNINYKNIKAKINKDKKSDKKTFINSLKEKKSDLSKFENYKLDKIINIFKSPNDDIINKSYFENNYDSFLINSKNKNFESRRDKRRDSYRIRNKINYVEELTKTRHSSIIIYEKLKPRSSKISRRFILSLFNDENLNNNIGNSHDKNKKNLKNKNTKSVIDLSKVNDELYKYKHRILDQNLESDNSENKLKKNRQKKKKNNGRNSSINNFLDFQNEEKINKEEQEKLERIKMQELNDIKLTYFLSKFLKQIRKIKKMPIKDYVKYLEGYYTCNKNKVIGPINEQERINSFMESLRNDFDRFNAIKNMNQHNYKMINYVSSIGNELGKGLNEEI